MQSQPLIDFADKVGLRDLDAKDCQQLVNLFNHDIHILNNTSAVISDSCEMLVESISSIIQDTYDSFPVYVDNYLNIDCLLSNKQNTGNVLELLDKENQKNQQESVGVVDPLMVALKQTAAYCLVLIVQEGNTELVFKAVHFLLKLFPVMLSYNIITVNLVTVINNVFYKCVLNEINGGKDKSSVLGAKDIRGNAKKDASNVTHSQSEQADLTTDLNLAPATSQENESSSISGLVRSDRRTRTVVNYSENSTGANTNKRVTSMETNQLSRYDGIILNFLKIFTSSKTIKSRGLSVPSASCSDASTQSEKL